MDHSVGAYLQRRSSRELIGFLGTCMTQGQWEQYYPYIGQIFQILKERNVKPPEEIVSSWNRFLLERDVQYGEKCAEDVCGL